MLLEGHATKTKCRPAVGSSTATTAGAIGAAWGRALERCLGVTRDLFREGRAVCDGVSGRLRAELRFTWLGGMRVLERVEHDRLALFNHRPALGAADVPVLVWRAARWTRQRAQR